MKQLNKQRLFRRAALTATMVMAARSFVFAVSFADVYKPIVELIDSFHDPFMAIVVAVGALYCIVLGMKYAQAEEPQERQKAKQHLKNAVIGYVLIFVLTFALNRLTPILDNWVSINIK